MWGSWRAHATDSKFIWVWLHGGRERMWYFICESGNTDKWCPKWFKKPTVHKPKRSRCNHQLYVRKVGMWVSELWKVLGCFAHNAKYQDDSWGKKRQPNTCPFGFYDAKHWEIFGNMQLSDIAMTNFLDEKLCRFFFNSLFWCYINHFWKVSLLYVIRIYIAFQTINYGYPESCFLFGGAL